MGLILKWRWKQSRANHSQLERFLLSAKRAGILLKIDLEPSSITSGSFGIGPLREISLCYETGNKKSPAAKLLKCLLDEGVHRAALVGKTIRHGLLSLHPTKSSSGPHWRSTPHSTDGSSHTRNAQGTYSFLITPHPTYMRLGQTSELRQAAYRELVAEQLDPLTIDDLRQYTQQ